MQVNKDGYLEKGPLQWIPPNMGGERVVRKKKKEGSADTLGKKTIARRTLVAGALLPGALYANLVQSENERKEKARNVPLDDGDAVTAPGLELELEDVLELPSPGKRSPEAIVLDLEESQGPQFDASNLQGKWVLPWVGGWERLWTSNPSDASLFGGPARDRVGQASFQLSSSRQFIYGPGEGGITLEYLFSASTANAQVLLARQGKVSNLGGNFFELDFPSKFDGFEVENKGGADFLTPLPNLPAGDAGAPVYKLTLQTTYLSASTWILRSFSPGLDPKTRTGQISVFRRTETRSVLDRRGLVADGQLKPPDDETIRYGRLLFGESLSDYAGWSEAAEKDSKGKSDLFKRGSLTGG
jgi:hypothetical protein